MSEYTGRNLERSNVYWKVVVLGGELAVSCTCNPLQQGLIPSGGRARWSLRRRYGVESWVLRGEASRTPSDPEGSSGK